MCVTSASSMLLSALTRLPWGTSFHLLGLHRPSCMSVPRQDVYFCSEVVSFCSSLHWTMGFICRNQIFQVPQDPLIVPSASCFTLQAPLHLQPFRRAIRIYTAWSSQGFGCLASAVRPSTSCPKEHGSLWCHKSSSCGAEALKVYPPKCSHILMETSSWCSESVSMWTLSAQGGYVSSRGSGTGFGTGCLELNLGSASARFASWKIAYVQPVISCSVKWQV